MRKELRVAGVLLAVVMVLSSCAGSPETVPGEPDESQNGRQQPEQSDPESSEESESESSEESTAEADDESQSTEQQPESQSEEEPIEVSDEVYEETFDEIEAVIEELNVAIAERDVEKWKEYLTEEYVAAYSDEERLAEISERPILERNDITLESLEDYFTEVVVPSRRNARLDDLRFLDEEEVQAVMEVNDSSVILYRLKKVNGSWKVDVG
ncbi:MAG: hypothetical protein R6V29_04040 [Spirochaetia bacterium]